METAVNVYLGKTVDEAIQNGLKVLGITREEAEIEVLEEGKKGILGFGAVKAQVKVTKKLSDGERAVEFIEGLLDLLNIPATCDLENNDNSIEINVNTTSSHQVIGRRGETLDAIQTIAGAVANIGRDDYTRVVVDCENYREQRENTLRELAIKLAKKAVEKGRKMTLEPMNPYERRIIHAALADNNEVKTVSDGKEPNRYIVIIPKNMKPYERREGENKPHGKKPFNKNRGGRRDNRPRQEGGENKPRPSSGAPRRGKKEIRFGTFLGNSGNKGEE